MRNGEHDEQADWIRAALDRYEGPLIRYAARITRDTDRARDVVQDTFLRLCKQKPSRLEGRLPEWLFTVCRNRALDVQRKENRLKPLTDQQIAVRASDDPSPSTLAERSETGSEVLKALETLPENQQEVIRLKFQNGLSYREISRVTNLSVTNVGYLIHAGIKTLRQKMKSVEGVHHEP